MITCTIDVILSEIEKVLSTLGRKKEAAPGDSADPGALDMQRHATTRIAILQDRGGGGVTWEQAPQMVKKSKWGEQGKKNKIVERA